MAFFVGAFVGALAARLVWENWAFGWTARHGLRADLFTLSRDDVMHELASLAKGADCGMGTDDGCEAAEGAPNVLTAK